MIESGCHIVRVEDEIKESTDHIGQILGEAMDKWNQRLNAFAHQFLKSMEELRARVDEHFDEVDRMMRDNGAAFHNFAARVQNARLLRMHTAITPILVLRPGNSPNVFEWKPHAWAPKNMKDAYFLGQRAKGLLHSDRDRLSREAIEAGSEIRAQRQARHRIMTLAEYHNVIVMSDDIDATEIALEDDSVDSYMEDILHVWGIQWEKVCELAEALQKPQSQQTGQKRLERTDREEKKRPRENKRNEANDILVDSMPDRG